MGNVDITAAIKQTSIQEVDAAAAQALKKASKSGTLAGLKHRDVQTALNSMYHQIAQALPAHITPERMIQMCTTEVIRNPKIAECDVRTFIGAMMQASILGFVPVSALGECYFVPYKGQVQFQIGYRGYVKLARQSGQVQQFYAETVYKDDDFHAKLGLSRDIIHTPYYEGKRSHDDLKFVYSVCIYKEGGYDFIILTKDEVERLRLRNPSQSAAPSGAWATDKPAMWRAKAAKQLSKWLPLEAGDGVKSLRNAAEIDGAIIPIEAMQPRGQGARIEDVDQIENDFSAPVAALAEPEPKPKTEKEDDYAPF